MAFLSVFLFDPDFGDTNASSHSCPVLPLKGFFAARLMAMPLR